MRRTRRLKQRAGLDIERSSEAHQHQRSQVHGLSGFDLRDAQAMHAELLRELALSQAGRLSQLR
jgi:hypothetical protein